MKRKMLSHLCTLLLAVCLLAGLLPPQQAFAAAIEPTESANAGNQNISNQTIHSYLYRRADGNYTRVECEDYGLLLVEVYDQNFKLLSHKEIPAEGNLWGGFFAGERYNFAVFGTYNFSKDNEAESIRVVKYSKDWERLDCWIGRGMNTTRPFDFGKLRMAEHDNLLYIHTCHGMYNGHQANMSLVLDQEKMSLQDSLTGVSYRNHGYVSHSFNQFVVVDSDGTRATLDHGDAYPRAFTVTIFPAGKGAGVSCIDLERFPGETGNNATAASAGGFEASGTHYLAAVCSDKSGNLRPPRDVTIYAVNKATKEVTSVQLTNDGMASTPQMVKLADNRFLVLWENLASDRIDTTGIGYAVLDGSGKLVGQVKTAGARLSDCKPIAVDGKALWYVTNFTAPTFYTLDDSGLKSYTATAGTGVTTPDPTPTASDSASAWAREQVDQAIAAGLVPSTLQGRYTQSITRQEFCALANAVYQKAKGDVTPTASFSDTSDPIVLKMATIGVVNGVGNNRFDPSGELTREQAATMLYRLATATGKPFPNVAATFADKGYISSWASKEAGAVQAAGIMNGVGNSRFDPKGSYTIEQSIVTMLRMYRYLNQ